jgi:GT2 family glycosyltransferase
MTQSVYILIPVHNRKAITLACLGHLRDLGAIDRYPIIIIDDGSTDGTAAAIRQAFPSVTILPGDGNLWWTGGIYAGMEYAYHQGATHFLWLNDDTLPLAGTLEQLISTCQTSPHRITSAQCYEDETLKTPTYGGQRKRGLSVALIQTLPGEIKSCDCMSGNLVCFGRSVIDRLGYPEKHLMPHYTADIVYTWEAKKKGFELLVLGDARAVCALTESSWSTSPMPMLDRWRQLNSPKSTLYPSSYWRYCQSFYGRWAFLMFACGYLKLVAFTIMRIVVPLSAMRSLKQWKTQVFN